MSIFSKLISFFRGIIKGYIIVSILAVAFVIPFIDVSNPQDDILYQGLNISAMIVPFILVIYFYITRIKNG